MSVNKQQLKPKSITAGTKDTHTCGNCSSVFLTIKAFVAHKKKGCTNADQSRASSAAEKEDGGVVAEPSREAKTDDGEVKKHKCQHEGCSYASKYPKDLERHSRIHTGEKPHRCEECGKCFSRLDKFKLHRRYHLGVKPYKCNQCDYASADGSSLKKHLRIHSDERPFKCQVCMYASRNSSQLVVHLRTHTGDTPFHCPHCSSKFKINSDLKRHLRLHTGEKPYQCTFCDYKCAVKGNLKTHHRLNHSNETNQSFVCDECEFSSPSKKLLIQHEKSQHAQAPFRCRHNNCAYKADSEATLKAHLKTSHTKDKLYKCSQCDYTSRQSGSVRSHTKKHHPTAEGGSGEKRCKGKVSSPSAHRFHCSLCPSTFARQDSLRSHVRHHPRHKEEEEEEAFTGLQLTVSEPDSSSVLSFYPGTEATGGEVVGGQPQLLYHLPPGLSLLSLPSDTVQYVFQTADSCVVLDNEGASEGLLIAPQTLASGDQLIANSAVL